MGIQTRTPVDILAIEAEVFIGFGSNLGDRCAVINQALAAVSRLSLSRLERLSSLYETAPVGYLDQGAFLNGVLALRTCLEAERLLAELLRIEAELGRVRKQRWGPRTIDLDIILFGDETISSDRLTVPHPELCNRLFVLEPLHEIAPRRLLPGLHKSVEEVLFQYRKNHPDETAATLVSAPPRGGPREVNDGIFYRYRQS